MAPLNVGTVRGKAHPIDPPAAVSPSPTRKLVPWLLALLATAHTLPLRAAPAPPPSVDPPGSEPVPSLGAAALEGPQPLVLRLNQEGWPKPDESQTAPVVEALLPPESAPIPDPPSPQAPPSNRTQARLQATPAEPPPDRRLVLDRRQRVLQVFEQGKELRRFPVAVGMPGWETPVGRFEVIEKTANPVWEHPANGRRYPSGPDNPLGSRWIGFYRDCKGRSGFNGQEHLEVKGCVTAGFHGTPNRSSVGQAVSHGCVRLFDENARELFDLVRLGTPVDVLP